MKKVVISGMIGNGLEWYDYALYGQFATIISRIFFPSSDPYLALMGTYSIFAAGFIMRPVGAVLFGYIGDKFGRKTALALSILMMSIPTACIGLLPSYEKIGILAPILLVFIRLLQGISLGGEFSGCIAFIVEHAPDTKRGIAGSSSMISMCLGILLGMIVATITNLSLDEEDFLNWGWRIPFILSLFVGLIGFYIRSHLSESPKYIEAKEKNLLAKAPARKIFKEYMPELVIASGMYLTVTVPFYCLVVFFKDFTINFLKYSTSDAFIINLISIIILTAAMPISAILSDRFGRKKILLGNIVAFIILTYPIFCLMSADSFALRLTGQAIFALIASFYIAPIPAALVELFPTSVRFTGVALSYNISAALFGGTTPIIATWLINSTGMNLSLAFYIIFIACATFAMIHKFKDRYREPLRIC